MLNYFLLNVVAMMTTLVSSSPEVVNSASHFPDHSEYAFYRGEIDLDSEGVWEIASYPSANDPKQLYLILPDAEEILMPGRRMRAVQRDRNIQDGCYHVKSLFWPCREYAKNHGHIGPSSVKDLDPERHEYVIGNVSRSPWGDRLSIEVEGPFIFLVPDVEFDFVDGGEWVKPENRRIMAVELRPFVGDGKHHVLYTDGSCNREEIDDELVKKYDLNIRPVIKEEQKPSEHQPATLVYTILAVRERNASGPFTMILRNVFTDASVSVEWDPSSAQPDEKSVSDDLVRARIRAWQPYAEFSNAPTLFAWLQHYQAEASIERSLFRPEDSVTAFNLLGGRAAIRETLQMQALTTSNDQDQERTIPVESLKGVEVQSHPFEEMLGGAKGGTLAMANLVPMDHFLVYVAKPQAIVPFLGKGADFLSHIGAALTGNSIKYHLERKYLARLGLTEQWVRTFLQSGAIKECALVVPDLFFIDGTEITVISRLAQPGMLEAMLKLLGISGLTGGGIVKHTLSGSGIAYFALEGDLLFISTSKEELGSVLKLKGNNGEGSLGRSAEFRYMLTQLPVKDESRMYAYFSDPFIRKLVGPRTKISQLRRMTARAEMEYLTSCALLAVMDGVKNPASLPFLVEKEYVPDRYLNSEYSLDKDLVVHSETYGTLADMKSLSALPLNRVTQGEQDAYKAYVDNYTNYWSRFFDPIAVRLDDTQEGALEATTFILPLIDNTFYNMLGEWMHKQEDNAPLKIPKLSKNPVIMLSVNLKDEAWRSILDDFSDVFEHYAHVSPAVMDDLGPALHLAIHDADPVIALGSGDLLGTFNASFIGGGGEEMMMIPLALSVLTRPCTLVVETQNPDRTRRFFKQAAYSGFQSRNSRNSPVSVSFHQVEGQDAWVCTLDIMGVMKLRYGLEVQRDFLLIRNIPWSNEARITRVETAHLNGARLDAFPDACNLQLPGLHATASASYRTAALQGIGHLYPLLTSGRATLLDVEEKHFDLFGFNPAHPGNGDWIWDGMSISSSKYGSVYNQRQPGYEEGDREFGMLKDLEYLRVNMQFEDSGLRTIVRWKLR